MTGSVLSMFPVVAGYSRTSGGVPATATELVESAFDDDESDFVVFFFRKTTSTHFFLKQIGSSMRVG
jgi:hypothetical protein